MQLDYNRLIVRFVYTRVGYSWHYYIQQGKVKVDHQLNFKLPKTSGGPFINMD